MSIIGGGTKRHNGVKRSRKRPASYPVTTRQATPEDLERFSKPQDPTRGNEGPR